VTTTDVNWDKRVVPPTYAVKRSWNGFDTFLRRAAMIGAVILIWVTIFFGVFAASAVTAVVHNVNTPDVNTTDLYTPDGGPSTVTGD
jgi:hypothetical protein